jgi:hypothetical protein
MTKRKERDLLSPNLRYGQIPRKMPKGKFIWHNHVQHCVGKPHGTNGFRYRNGLLPINHRKFERCYCGVIELPHYKIRGLGSGKCVSEEQVLRNTGMSPKQVKKLMNLIQEQIT